jgi:dihydroxyacetone kinase
VERFNVEVRIMLWLEGGWVASIITVNHEYVTLQMVDTITDYMAFSEDPKHEYAVMVNNLGTSSCMEMGVLLNAVAKYVSQTRKLDIRRMYCGTFMTATDMSGFSISIMQLSSRWKGYLDDHTQVTLYPSR